MPQNNQFKSLIAILSFLVCLTAGAASPEPATLSGIHGANFKIVADYKIIIAVNINGAGPFDMQLDTGANRSVVDEQLAAQLGLPVVDRDTIRGVQGSVEVAVVRTGSVSLAGEEVQGLDILAQKHLSDMPGKVRGILGEDFLHSFDILIDYRHRTVQLESGAGTLADTLDGERLPVRLHGSVHGVPTPDRLIVAVQAKELGGAAVSVQLDSGANALVLYGGPAALGEKAERGSYSVASALNESSKFAASALTIKLHLGGKTVANITALAPPKVSGVDSDGVMPTSAFKAIFISHSGQFVILDPSVKAATANRAAQRTAMPVAD